MVELSYREVGPYDIPHIGPRRVRLLSPPRDGMPRPVLVMFDGQNVFHDEPSFAGGWRLHESVPKLAAKRRAPLVVAVDHGGASRIHELTPWPMGDKSRGLLDHLLDWMATDLARMVIGDLGGSSEPAEWTLGGSSLGGLAAMYGHFKRPDRFGGALVMSPSFWYGRGKIFDFVAAQSDPWRSRVYLDAGGREGPGVARHVARMADHLRGRGWGADRLRLRIDKRGGHDELSWRRRAPTALRFFLPPAPSQTLAQAA